MTADDGDPGKVKLALQSEPKDNSLAGAVRGGNYMYVMAHGAAEIAFRQRQDGTPLPRPKLQSGFLQWG
ncbi:predicted protein [Coccidioides posadasii str. Silveira]|uniref:Predicted protein n=1 Tax=Coccidioides posadasii (strain RMSCC 757 / Silveira) TaxID=443226 RepID=E9D8X1_COCPS|nr:predicted protein [Coccidioides posadasii str. Silveira]